jgi:septal ring factor EnvC (AmiA/AmiB activator)
MSELEQKLDQSEQKQAKLANEFNALSNKSRQTEERHAAEISRLQQENEELAKGLQQLKNLEIQLEKRKKRRR